MNREHADVSSNLQRMVVKDCNLIKENYSLPKSWYDQLPMEIALHRRIDRKRKREDVSDPGFNHIVEHRGYRLMMHKRRYRLYLEYCSGGDLARTVSRVFHAWDPEREGRGYPDLLQLSEDELSALPIIPEALVWYIFRSLVKAYMILHHGTTSHEETDPDWKPVTHLDVNFCNVFIRSEAASKGSPQIVLADFGMGFINRDSLPTEEVAEPLPSENPFERAWGMIHENHPIEHQFVTGDPPFKLGEKSDVWKLGSMIWEFITCGVDSDKPMRENGPAVNDDGEPILGRDGRQLITKLSVTSVKMTERLNAEAMFPTPRRFYLSADRYSTQLKDLVRECLHWSPSDRITLRRLDEEIESYINSNPLLMNNAAVLLDVQNDPFTIGSDAAAAIATRP